MRAAARELLTSLLVTGVIYANVAVMLGPRGLPTPLPLPLPAAVADFFDLFGMFRFYDTINQELLVWGLPAAEPPAGHAAEPRRWIRLGARELFPGSPNHRIIRAWCGHHRSLQGPAAQREAWSTLARKIRERHNRQNPEYGVSRVWLQVQVWPKSTKDLDRHKVRGKLQVNSWYREEEVGTAR